MSAPLVVSRGWIVDEHERGRDLGDGWRLADLLGHVVGDRVVYLVDRDRAAAEGWAESGGGVVVDVTGDESAEPWRYLVRTEIDGYACGGKGAGRLGMRIAVVDVAADAGELGGPWRGLSARELVRAFVAFRKVCGVDWSSSTGRTAEALILSTHPRVKGGTLLDRDPVTPAVVEDGSLEIPFASWRRPLTQAEQGAGYLHVFDANAQYLAAWQAAELGHGMPVEHRGPLTFDPGRVGFWYYPGGLDGIGCPGGELLPAPWLPGREWFSTATIRRALEVCDGLDFPLPAGAWLWPKKSRFLRAAGERLRDARKGARDAAAAARSVLGVGQDPRDVEAAVQRLVTAEAVEVAVKSLYAVETGRFGWLGRAASSPWRRPDWAHTVRATARVNLHRRLTQLGAAPFAIATDGLCFLDDEPDPIRFAERIRLPIGPHLGQYKHELTVPTYELDEDAQLEKGRPGRLITHAAAAAERGTA